MKYNKIKYFQYIDNIKKTLKAGESPISFKKWKIVQPVADNIIGNTNDIIANGKIKEVEK